LRSGGESFLGAAVYLCTFRIRNDTTQLVHVIAFIR